MPTIRLTQIDGALPNLALMRLGAWHRAQGDTVFYTRHVERLPEEPDSDAQYGSAIFRFSHDRISRFRSSFPAALLGGTGADPDNRFRVEQIVGEDFNEYDYSGYPDFSESIGFTQRGCRLKCKFCVVPQKEGKPRSVNTIRGIWRGVPYPKKIHLLDNDFFGNPEWRDRIAEIQEGEYRVCLSQGINVRLLTEDAAVALASVQYRDTKFKRRLLYTAWDNLKDENIFFRGVDLLERAGVPPKHLMAYMLIGFDPAETWERIWHRFDRMVARGILPYPMVYDRTRKDLLCFQRWVITGLYRFIPWGDYRRHTRSAESTLAWLLA